MPNTTKIIILVIDRTFQAMKRSLIVIVSLALSLGAFVATTAVAVAGSFPTITLSYINPTTINPQAFSYQMADYDAQRNQVIFYPYGVVAPPVVHSGMLLTYNVGSNNVRYIT
jgi:hypothetical protein